MRKKRLEDGLCRDCGEAGITTTRSLRGNDRAAYCKVCYFKLLARSVLGSGKKWRSLADMVEACDWECHYTGEKLVIGDTLSFDHMDPVSRFPERKHDITNIVPCSWRVNLMKKDLTKGEFLEMTTMIHLRNHKLVL